ncbi:MAG: LysR substrate-binding domain-containing protein [Hyphomicrobiaceae bacterium]
MIDLDSLDIFRAVAREGGVLRAAETLNRVPSNVTTRIKQMEDRLGVELLRRQGRNVVLTQAGQTLLVYAERLLKLAGEAEAATRGAPSFGQLRLGSMESTAASRLPKVLADFHRRHPGVGLTIETGTTGALIRKVRDYQLDAAFVGEPFASDGVNAQAVFEETLVLVTARSQRALAGAGDLSSRTILTFTKGCSYRKRLEGWLSSQDITVERVLELASYQAIIACAAAGAGCGIMPMSVVRSLRAARDIRCHALPDEVARNATHLVWMGAPSWQLEQFMSLVAGIHAQG